MKNPKWQMNVPIKTALARATGVPLLVAAACSLLCSLAPAAQFQEVTTAAGISNEVGYCVGAAWGDYDNDGYPDFYIAIGAGANRVNALYHNNCDGTFTRKTGAQVGPIASDSHPSFGCNWVDFNNDGYLDMLVINGWSGARNDLYLNNGDGTFQSVKAGRLTDQSMTSSWASCADYDGDGLVDIFLSESPSAPFATRLYHATPSGTFATNDFGPPVANCNDAAWGDYNNDGKPDLYVCNWNAPSSLWRNDGRGTSRK
ncbi:MAG: VCBS repeat-containing protein [Verrucomicrobiota bacterium]